MERMANGRKKKYKIKSINFGQPGEPSRELIDQYEKEYGSMKTSELIRDLVVQGLSSNKEFDKYKIKNLMMQRKNLFETMKNVQKELEENGEKLSKLGISDEQISNI